MDNYGCRSLLVEQSRQEGCHVNYPFSGLETFSLAL